MAVVATKKRSDCCNAERTAGHTHRKSQLMSEHELKDMLEDAQFSVAEISLLKISTKTEVGSSPETTLKQPPAGLLPWPIKYTPPCHRPREKASKEYQNKGHS